MRDSQFNLGVLYGRGLGAAQDMAQSWMWFSLAAKQGDTDAARKRDEVANRMDGRAMTSAQEDVRGVQGRDARTPPSTTRRLRPPPRRRIRRAAATPKAAAGVKG